MRHALAAAFITATLSGSAHADLSFNCTFAGFANCPEPLTGVFVADLGPSDSYRVTLPNGHESLITLADESWTAGGRYSLEYLAGFGAMELYIYGIRPDLGFETFLWRAFGGPDTTGTGRDWQSLGTWSITAPAPTSIVPEPGTLAIVVLALAAAGLARRGVSTGGSGS